MLERYDPATIARTGGSGRGRVILVVVLALIVLAAGGGFLGVASAQASGPASAAQQFCQDLQAHRYDDAWSLMSPDLQAATPRAMLASLGQWHDQLDGTIGACDTHTLTRESDPFAPFSATTTQVSLRVRRNVAYAGALTMTRASAGWRISKLDMAAVGSDLSGLVVADRFCTAVSAGHFDQAYDSLSARARALISKDAYTASFTSALTTSNARVTGCALSVSTFTLDTRGAQVDATVQLQVQGVTAGGVVQAPLRLVVTKDATGWGVDEVRASVAAPS
ncbi:MAG TPA: hypothetical protein VF807_06780 [Ktedonobacterales bacterium]